MAFLQALPKSYVKGNKMSDEDRKISAMSELQPYFDSYLEKMRKAKNSSGLTLQELSDLSGVPYNNICDTNSGRTKQPLLFYEAAKCKALGLSLNAMCGLDEPQRSGLAQKQRTHELELDNARLAAIDEQKDKRLETARVIVGALTSVSVLLLLVVIGYMVFGAHILNAGLFRSAGVSAFFVFLVLLVIAALAAIGYALRFLFRK